MPGDYTRFTYNPLEDHAGVFMQQGRVQLDADWNELVELLDRRWRAETVDIIGRCVVPKETPDGFKIAIAGSGLTIGRGRLYAHGLLAENHGTGVPEFDAILGEVRGPDPIPYLNQPYYPNPQPLPAAGAGPLLIYADVWRREVTALEDPDLVEKAVGVDTATRIQTVWQVRALPNVGNITCSTPPEKIPGWQQLVSPSAGRLTTAAAGVPSTQDPCTIPPNGGYRGTENRLYRVEIHDQGAPAAATFKWSRDNGSVATTVTSIDAGLSQLSVVRIGRDAVLRFAADDWAEVTDDWHELNGKPGVMRKVLSVDEVNLTLTLANALPAGEFDATDAARHTRVRRWDQKGIVRDPAGNPVADVDASGGVIPISAGTSIILEDGVQITFSTSPVGGDLHALDYWVFAARTADASVEQLTAAPPRGVHHHFCRLAVVTFPSTVIDCRTLWPPDAQGSGCDCNACVSADSHNKGTSTIQMAIDKVKPTGGKVCLGPGIFSLGDSAVSIQGAASVSVEGRGPATILLFAGKGPAVIVDGSIGVSLSRFAVLATHPPTTDVTGSDSVLALRSSALVTVERCILLDVNPGDVATGAAIALQGPLFGLSIRDNVVAGGIGIAAVTGVPAAAVNLPLRYVLTWNLSVEDNLFWCLARGVSFEGLVMHAGKTNLRGNAFLQCTQAGILDGGWVLDEVFPGSQLDVESNSLNVSGTGVWVGTRATRIAGNDIGAFRAGQASAGIGIGLRTALDTRGPDGCQVTANRIFRFGDGVLISGRARAVAIRRNVIDGAARGGIVMDERGRAQDLAIEGNLVRNVGPAANAAGGVLAGIHVQRVERLAITGNSVSGVGPLSVQNAQRAGIRAAFCGVVRIAENQVIDIGPVGESGGETEGIDILSGFLRADISENVVRRAQNPPAAPVKSPWWALRIGRAPGTAPVNSILMLTQSAFFAAFSISDLAAVMVQFVVVGTQAFVLPKTQVTTAVRGNLFDAYGSGPAVEINQDGACTIGENHCFTPLPQDPASAGPATLIATAGAIVCSGNYVVGPRAGSVVVLNTGKGPFTVLGNITSAPISVNGPPLLPPWAPLNVIGI